MNADFQHIAGRRAVDMNGAGEDMRPEGLTAGGPFENLAAATLIAAVQEETEALYAAARTELAALGAALVEDPFLGSGFSDLALTEVEFDDRGLESMVYDMELFLRRLGPSCAASSFAGLKALIPEDPFGPEGMLNVHARDSSVLRRSLEDPAVPPDLSGFLRLRTVSSSSAACGARRSC